MTALWPILWKEVLHIARDGRSLVAALALPVLMLVMFGYAIEFDVKDISVAVIDYDRTPASRELIEQVGADGTVRITATPRTEAELDKLMDTSRVRMGIVIPRGYGAGIAAGEVVPVQILVDGTEATFAGLALNQVGGAIGDAAFRDLRAALVTAGGPSDLPGLHTRPRVFFNEGLDSTWFIVPGLIAVIVAMLAAMLTSQCVAREYEQNTIEQILVSPVNGFAVMLGKLVPYVGLGVIQVVTVTVASRFLFGVPIRGSILLLSFATLLYLVGSMAFGLTLSALLKSQQVAMQIAFVATMLPSLLLSGFIFPLENMPVVLQGLSYAVAARYYIVITRGLFLKDVGISILSTELLAMVVYAAVLLLIATSRFRRTLA